VLLASVGVLAFAFAGCGSGSHAAGPAAADVNGAVAAGATTASTSTAASTSTTGTGTTGTGTSTTSVTQSGSTTSPGASGKGSGSGTGAPATGGSASKHGSNNPPSGQVSIPGKQTVHGGKPKTKSGASSGAGAGSGGAAGSGSSGSSGASAPNANTGVPYEIATSSMEPTFQPETKIYYDPTRTHPQIGEVIVFYLPAGGEDGACGEAMIGGRACANPEPGQTASKSVSFKRVVGLPGDSIAIHEGRVIRNGQPESEPPIFPCGKDEKVECEYPTPITVPADHYYVMADNRGLPKEDSRIFGAVPQEYILGTVEGG
jgi:signal peptidase I